MKILSLIAFFALVACSTNQTENSYPNHWWAKLNIENPPSWEILPERGEPGKTLILSKRNELGVLSNFAHTPFIFEGKKYESVEGLWQSMKFPEGASDPRGKLTWKLKRNQVEQMTAFEAKRAGGEGSKNMKKLGINWVSYKGKQMTYRTTEKGEHYQLIKRIMIEKLKQNKKVQDVLLATGDLELLPDHKTRPNSPPAWKYNVIWMELRDQLRNNQL